MIQGFSYPLGERSFSSAWCSHSNQWFPLVAVCHLIMLRCFHKSTTSLFFSLLVFQQHRSILLFKEALSNSIVIEVVVLFSVSWFHSFICPEGIVMFSSTHHLILEIMFFSLLIHLTGVSCFHSSSLILSSFASFLNQSAVWNLSYPLCHFSILLEAVCCWFHQVSSNLLKFMLISSIFSRSAVQIISFLILLYLVLTGVV